MRITGLASGMDTETMIKDMMKAQRLPMDKILQRKQYMEWQRDDYRTVNRQLFDFRNLVSDNVNRQSTYLQKTVSSSAPDDISIRNINSTEDFSGTLKITKLATQATVQSSDIIVNNVGVKIDPSQKLSTYGFSNETLTIRSLKEDGTLGNPVSIVIDSANETMESLVKKINDKTGVYAFFDNYSGKLALTSKQSGANDSGDEIVVTGNSNLLTFLKIDTPLKTAGLNAEFEFNGLSTQRLSNTFQINGFEVNLKKASSTTITFNSTPDTDKIFESVKKFVDEYNKILSDLNGQIREKSYRDFQPLTTEQRADLEEKEIELWEEKSKSGTLRNDSIISSALRQMRSILNSSVKGLSGNVRLSDIGISPSNDYSEKGKLVIDDAKLKQAITSDPNKLYELFSSSGTTESEKGLGERLKKTLDDTRKKVIEKAGTDSAVNNSFSLGRTLNGFDSQITRFESRLQMVETRYYRQFGAMEAAIQRANQQSAYIMNSFGGGQ